MNKGNSLPLLQVIIATIKLTSLVVASTFPWSLVLALECVITSTNKLNYVLRYFLLNYFPNWVVFAGFGKVLQKLYYLL